MLKRLALAHEKFKEYDKAIVFLSEAIRVDPENSTRF